MHLNAKKVYKRCMKKVKQPEKNPMQQSCNKHNSLTKTCRYAILKNTKVILVPLTADDLASGTTTLILTEKLSLAKP